MPDASFTKGLEGVVAAKSSITYLDGLKGKMLYRGYSCPELATKTQFEEIVYLLWEGELPTQAQLGEFNKEFLAYRALPPEILDLMKKFPVKAHPMDILRATASLLGAFDVETPMNTPQANRHKATRLVARMATIAAAWDRIRKGQEPIAPDNSLSYSANFLYMLTGNKPDDLSVRTIDAYLTLLADHDLNASTFAARVVISTLSDMHSAVSAALGALKGPLHGGANEAAMNMILEIGSESKADAYIEKAVAEKKKIMGFGHRVYRVEDPRSVPLKELSRQLSEAKGNMLWYNISVKVAAKVFELKKINTNVDFYSASALYLLGIDTDMFTPIFAMSRTAGWTAHIFEQMNDNRLIRPTSDYVGHKERPFVPIEARK